MNESDRPTWKQLLARGEPLLLPCAHDGLVSGENGVGEIVIWMGPACTWLLAASKIAKTAAAFTTRRRLRLDAIADTLRVPDTRTALDVCSS